MESDMDSQRVNKHTPKVPKLPGCDGLACERREAAESWKREQEMVSDWLAAFRPPNKPVVYISHGQG